MRTTRVNIQVKVNVALCLIATAVLVQALFGAASKAPPYDPAAVPDATAERQRLLNVCQALTPPPQTVRAAVDCTLKAYRAYAVREKLRNMVWFDEYAKVSQATATDVDAGRLTRQEGQRRITAARLNYESRVDAAYMDFKRQNPPVPKGAAFNPTALQTAVARHDSDINACGPWNDKQAVLARVSCVRAAGDRFTNTIELADKGRYYGYLSVLMADVEDARAGRRAPETLAQRQQVLWADFLGTLR